MSAAPGLVVIVDDDADMRSSIEFLLSIEGRPTLGLPSAEAMLETVPPAGAACVLADVRLGQGMDGIALVEALRRRGDPVPVVVITGHADVPMAVRAMRAGAVDFIEKPFEPDRLLGAVAEASARRGSPAAEPASAAARGLIESLTPRERQVLAGLVAGQPNKLVAHDLGISPRTVETYRASIMEKLGTRSLAQVVRIALEAGVTG